MSSKNDLMVFDEEYEFAKDYLINYSKELTGRIDSFNSALETLLEIAVKDEAITQELRKLIEELNGLKPLIDETVSSAASDCSSFVSAIDKADQFLY